MMMVYAKLYSFFYPALFLAIAVQCRFTVIGQSIIEAYVNKFPASTLFVSIPVAFWVVTFIVSVLLFVFSGPLYRFDFNTLYGRMMTKLEELIHDMEVLRQ